MRATLIRYERIRNLGNYENEKVGVEVELDEGETAEQGLRAARDFVCKAVQFNLDERLVKAKNVVANPDKYDGSVLERAQQYIVEHPEPVIVI